MVQTIAIGVLPHTLVVCFGRANHIPETHFSLTLLRIVAVARDEFHHMVLAHAGGYSVEALLAH